jgi:hypothetical protein
MLLDRKKYTESAYIGEELLSEHSNERERKCMVVEQTITDGDFSFDEALEAYQVSREEYEAFIARKSNFNILSSFSGASADSEKSMYFEVVTKMLNESASHSFEEKISKRLEKVTKELKSISKALYKEKV